MEERNDVFSVLDIGLAGYLLVCRFKYMIKEGVGMDMFWGT